MSPRTYRMGKRATAAGNTRARILEAARQLLAGEAETELSLEAVARRADVSRLTIYYQFKSRPGLLEALYDYLAARGHMQRMAEVFHESDGWLALEKLVRTFVGFWSSDPVVIRRLRAMAALDAEIGPGLRARDGRRPHIARAILKMMPQLTKKTPEERDAAANLIATLTSFEVYDSLARVGHNPEQIISMISRLCRSALA